MSFKLKVVAKEDIGAVRLLFEDVEHVWMREQGWGRGKKADKGPETRCLGRPGRSTRGGRGDNVKGSLSCRVCVVLCSPLRRADVTK